MAKVLSPLPKSSSKVGFGESLKLGQNEGPEVGFPGEVKRKHLLPDLLIDLF